MCPQFPLPGLSGTEKASPLTHIEGVFPFPLFISLGIHGKDRIWNHIAWQESYLDDLENTVRTYIMGLLGVLSR